MSVLKDIRTGALPAKEIPGFIAFSLRRLAWFFIALAVLGTILLVK